LTAFKSSKKALKTLTTYTKTTVYENGAIAKIAIYCSNIEVLEEEVYPFLTRRAENKSC
jgi:type III restriction enzyme